MDAQLLDFKKISTFSAWKKLIFNPYSLILFAEILLELNSNKARDEFLKLTIVRQLEMKIIPNLGPGSLRRVKFRRNRFL